MNNITDPIKMGDLELANRVVMAPMTRSRSGLDGVPTDLMAKYYAQRAEVGLIVSEATNISPMSCAFERAPGLFRPEQVEGWKKVTSAVHNAGGKIVAQLWHCGRVGALGVLDGKEPLSPSGFNDDIDNLHVWALLDNRNYVRIAATPSRAMTVYEIKETIKEYQQAAQNAMEAGFDGVEIHAANGYLPHQFLSSHVNRRTDEFGGPVENRARFLNLIVDAIATVMPLSRVGVRVSPYAAYNSALDNTVEETYGHVSEVLNDKGVAYIHIADVNGWYGAPDLEKIHAIIAPKYTGTLISNGGLTIERAQELVREEQSDMVAFGRYFISNPDLVTRIKLGVPLNELREDTLYCAGEDGYTDYPFYSSR